MAWPNAAPAAAVPAAAVAAALLELAEAPLALDDDDDMAE
jgi:hypothetical protein